MGKNLSGFWLLAMNPTSPHALKGTNLGGGGRTMGKVFCNNCKWNAGPEFCGHHSNVEHFKRYTHFGVSWDPVHRVLPSELNAKNDCRNYKRAGFIPWVSLLAVIFMAAIAVGMLLH